MLDIQTEQTHFIMFQLCKGSFAMKRCQWGVGECSIGRIYMLMKKSRSAAFGQSGRNRKHYLQELESQVNKSRIAIENMSHTRAIENGLHRKVQELQRELHHCILSIERESAKQSTLTSLNQLLRGRMSEVQAVQRNEQEYESNTFEKRSKKVEYDVKQILHKFNEEVAKINSLKEQANAARDERVVYSNLFNKIEKEIKHYEQLYKQTLIANQLCLDQKRVPTPPLPEPPSPRPSVQASVQRLPEDGPTTTREHKRSLKPTPTDTFLTQVKQFKKEQPRRQDSQGGAARVKNTSLNHNIETLIREKEGEIERVIVTAECTDLATVLVHYSSLEQQNDSLVIEVATLDERIALFQEDVERLRRQKRTSEIYQNGQILDSANLRKCRSNKFIRCDPLPESHSLTTLFEDICLTIGVVTPSEEPLNDQLLRQVDRTVEQLGCCHFERRARKESRLMSAQQVGSAADRAVCEMLEKIDRFAECEKILDRTALQQEYQRQLSKARRKGKKSN